MVEAGLFANAATVFAQAGWRRFQVRQNRQIIESAYETAAEKVVNLYDGHSRDVWNSIVDLLKCERCAKALVPGQVYSGELAGLKGVYKLEKPPLSEVLGHMIAEIAHVIHDTLPQDHQILADIMTMWQQQLEVLQVNRHEAVMSRFATLEHKLDSMSQQGGTSSESAEFSLTPTPPPDEGYRVDRPELEELATRLENTQTVGISGAVGVGGAGGVGKSLLAIHYANQEFPKNTLYISMDAGTQRPRMTRLAQMMGVSLGDDQDEVTMSAGTCGSFYPDTMAS